MRSMRPGPRSAAEALAIRPPVRADCLIAKPALMTHPRALLTVVANDSGRSHMPELGTRLEAQQFPARHPGLCCYTDSESPIVHGGGHEQAAADRARRGLAQG